MELKQTRIGEVSWASSTLSGEYLNYFSSYWTMEKIWPEGKKINGVLYNPTVSGKRTSTQYADISVRIVMLEAAENEFYGQQSAHPKNAGLKLSASFTRATTRSPKSKSSSVSRTASTSTSTRLPSTSSSRVHATTCSTQHGSVSLSWANLSAL
jgi:hypothetical protein